MSLVAGVEEFAFAFGRDGEDLSFVTGGDIKSSVGRKSEVPDVFCFRIEENGFLAGGRNFVNIAVGRCADIKSAPGVKSDGLGREVCGIENHTGFAIRIEAEYLCGRAAGGVECALGIKPDGPQIGSV